MKNKFIKEFLFGMSLVCLGTSISAADHKKYLGPSFNMWVIGLGAATFFCLMVIACLYATAGALISPQKIGLIAIVTSFVSIATISWAAPATLKKINAS